MGLPMTGRCVMAAMVELAPHVHHGPGARGTGGESRPNSSAGPPNRPTLPTCGVGRDDTEQWLGVAWSSAQVSLLL